MLKKQLILSLVAVAGLGLMSQTARGDLLLDQVSCGLPSPQGHRLVSSAAVSSDRSNYAAELIGLDRARVDLDVSGASDQGVAEDVLSLPAAPDSATLLLSAALSVGAWHVVRSARNIHLSHLPAWYHSEGPDQVGHSFALTLDYAPVVLCTFDEPVPFQRVLPIDRRLLDDGDRLLSQYYLCVEAPRGPPSLG